MTDFTNCPVNRFRAYSMALLMRQEQQPGTHELTMRLVGIQMDRPARWQDRRSAKKAGH